MHFTLPPFATVARDGSDPIRARLLLVTDTDPRDISTTCLRMPDEAIR